MPIERVGSIVTTSSSSAGTSAVVNLPANIPANSRVVIAIAITDNVTTATAPGTWAAAIASAINGVRLQTWYNYSSTPSSGGTVTITLSTSQDWVAMAACYTGAHFHGFATLTNSADLVRFASTGDGTVDTTITLNASAPIRYSGQGLGQRLAFSAVKDATTGFVSLDANTGTMSIQSEGVSSGATPVTLAWAEDTVEPPSGSWTTTATTNASTNSKVIGVMVLRPDVGPFYYTSIDPSNSSSADAAGTVTIPSAAGRNLVYILHFCCRSSTATFSVPSPWQQVHSTTTGNLHVETYVAYQRDITDFTLDWTASESVDRTIMGSVWQDTELSSDPADGGILFQDWAVDVDTVNDTAITSTSMTADQDGRFSYIFSAATGTSQAISAVTASGDSTTLLSTSSNGLSSGSPPIRTDARYVTTPRLSGHVGTMTSTFTVATTEKLLFTALLRGPNMARKENIVTQQSINRSSRW